MLASQALLSRGGVPTEEITTWTRQGPGTVCIVLSYGSLKGAWIAELRSGEFHTIARAKEAVILWFSDPLSGHGRK